MNTYFPTETDRVKRIEEAHELEANARRIRAEIDARNASNEAEATKPLIF